jgi:DNA-binding response OmpR family regulator
MTYARKRYEQTPRPWLAPQTPPRAPLIVLLEPDEAIRELLSDVLTFQGYRVHIAAPHTSAATIASLQPQGVIFDVGPILSGSWVEFIDELRRSLAELDLAVLLTTTSTWVDTTNAAFLRLLGCEILYQPFELQSLLDWATYRLPSADKN